MKSLSIRQSAGDRVFKSVVVVVCIAWALICLLPLLYVLAVSFSSNSAILNSKVGLWPVEATTQAYQQILSDKSMVFSLFYSAAITIGYTLLSMFLSVCAAYALTKKRLKGRTGILVFIVITMFFSGGLIPDYLLVRDLGLLDNPLSLILPGAFSVFNVIILKSFFSQIPESYEESAMLDGANEFRMLARIVLPISGPVIATVSLFYAVGKWNSFLDALFYISSPQFYPIQLKLYQIVVNSTSLDVQAVEGAATSAMLPESIKAACVMFATIPILLVYPWLQKYFIKGTTLGGIKE